MRHEVRDSTLYTIAAAHLNVLTLESGAVRLEVVRNISCTLIAWPGMLLKTKSPSPPLEIQQHIGLSKCCNLKVAESKTP